MEKGEIETFWPYPEIVYPLNQVVFHSDNLHPPGRPKSDWLQETYLDACKQQAGPIAMFDPDSEAHLQVVKQQALQRLDPFPFQMMAHQALQPLQVKSYLISS